MPFLQLNVWPNGNLKPCCISKDFENVKINNLSVKDAYNSDEFKQLRRDMINGVKNPLCSVCYDSE
jgi:radical SAM protein with 4Fe4S-binding SPASM domain